MAREGLLVELRNWVDSRYQLQDRGMLPGSHYAQTEASLDGCAGALRHQEQNCRSVSQMLLETHVLKNAVAHALRCGGEITRDRRNPCAVLSGAVVESKFRPELLPRKALGEC
jgi:hypothetical protein